MIHQIIVTFIAHMIVPLIVPLIVHLIAHLTINKKVGNWTLDGSAVHILPFIDYVCVPLIVHLNAHLTATKEVGDLPSIGLIIPLINQLSVYLINQLFLPLIDQLIVPHFLLVVWGSSFSTNGRTSGMRLFSTLSQENRRGEGARK